jgi:hypothetical protein
MSVAWVGAGVAAVGAISSADSSRSAANKQADAAREANETELQMYNQSRQDQMPWLTTGGSALNQLSMQLGLPAYVSQEDRGAIRASLLPQFTAQSTTQTPAVAPTMFYGGNPDNGPTYEQYLASQGQPATSTQQSTVDEAGLNAAIEAEIAKRQQAAQSNPLYGSLTKTFTAADMNADPVYQSGFQFGLDEGVKGINRQMAAAGSLNSGATLKALTRFGNDYATTKGEGAYNRFNNNQTQQFNRLASLAGVGQTASTNLGTQSISTGNSLANNITGAGNARAAGYIGQSNAVNNGISQGWNMYQGNQLLNRLGSQQQQSYLSNYTPQYAGTGNPYGWTNGDS